MAANVPTSPSPALEYGNWTPAYFQPRNRSIGGIVAQVTIDEQGVDEIQITDHPVEQGAPISDHAYKQPVTININAGWSVAHSYDLSAETGVYGLLLSWQAAFVPFDVITGKRSYSNMLMQRLVVTTDNHSEWALMAQIACRQVIIVATQEAKATGMSDQPGDHASPSDTAPNMQSGEQATPAVANPASVQTATVANDSNAQGISGSEQKGIDLGTALAL